MINIASLFFFVLLFISCLCVEIYANALIFCCYRMTVDNIKFVAGICFCYIIVVFFSSYFARMMTQSREKKNSEFIFGQAKGTFQTNFLMSWQFHNITRGNCNYLISGEKQGDNGSDVIARSLSAAIDHVWPDFSTLSSLICVSQEFYTHV